jgi:ABC-type lipoprotein release transport system permease subunit
LSGGYALIESPLGTVELRESLQALIDSGGLDANIVDLRSLRSLLGELLAADRARSWLTFTTAVLVVALAGLGFYGTQRYLVAAGRREYAIRAALGAGPRSLSRLVFVRGLMLCLPGLALGVVLAFTLVAWLRDEFISREVPPGIVTLLVVAGMTLLLLAASWGPARQARLTQPASLLRED